MNYTNFLFNVNQRIDSLFQRGVRKVLIDQSDVASVKAPEKKDAVPWYKLSDKWKNKLMRVNVGGGISESPKLDIPADIAPVKQMMAVETATVIRGLRPQVESLEKEMAAFEKAEPFKYLYSKKYHNLHEKYSRTVRTLESHEDIFRDVIAKEPVGKGEKLSIFQRGIGEGTESIVAEVAKFQHGETPFHTLYDVLKISDKIEIGAVLDEDERLKIEELKARGLEAAVPKPAAYHIGAVVPQIAKYGLTFKLTGGAYYAVNEAVASAASKAMPLIVAKLAGGIAGGVAQGSIWLPGIAEGTAEYLIPNWSEMQSEIGEAYGLLETRDKKMSFKEALVRAWGSQVVEFTTERAGIIVENGLGFLARATIGKFISLRGITKITSPVNRLLKTMGWNGIIGEVFEEELAEPFQAAIEERPYVSLARRKEGLPFVEANPEAMTRLAVETLGIAAFGVLAGASGVAVAGVRAARKIGLKSGMGDVWGDRLAEERGAVPQPVAVPFGMAIVEVPEEPKVSYEPATLERLQKEGLAKGIDKEWVEEGADLVVRNGEIVGMVKQEEDGTLTTLEIKPEYRGKGIATEVIKDLYRDKPFKVFMPNTSLKALLRKVGEVSKQDKDGYISVKPEAKPEVLAEGEPLTPEKVQAWEAGKIKKQLRAERQKVASLKGSIHKINRALRKGVFDAEEREAMLAERIAMREDIKRAEEKEKVLAESYEGPLPEGANENWRLLDPQLSKPYIIEEPEKATDSQKVVMQLVRKDMEVSPEKMKSLVEQFSGQKDLENMTRFEANKMIDYFKDKAREKKDELEPEVIEALGLTEEQASFINVISNVSRKAIPKEDIFKFGFKLAAKILRERGIGRAENIYGTEAWEYSRKGRKSLTKYLDNLFNPINGKFTILLKENKIKKYSESSNRVIRLVLGTLPAEGKAKLTEKEVKVANEVGKYFNESFDMLYNAGIFSEEDRRAMYFPIGEKGRGKVSEGSVVGRSRWKQMRKKNVFFGSLLPRSMTSEAPEELDLHDSLHKYAFGLARKVLLEPLLGKAETAANKFIGDNPRLKNQLKNWLEFQQYTNNVHSATNMGMRFFGRVFSSSVLGLITAIKQFGFSFPMAIAELRTDFWRGLLEYSKHPAQSHTESSKKRDLMRGLKAQFTGTGASVEDLGLGIERVLIEKGVPKMKGPAKLAAFSYTAFKVAQEVSLTPQLVSNAMVSTITMEGAKIRGKKMGLKGEKLDAYIEKIVVRTNPSAAREEVMPLFAKHRLWGLFVQSRLKTVDWVLQKGIEGDYAGLLIWAFYALIFGKGTEWLLGERTYTSKKTGKQYAHPVMEALEFIDPLDLRRIKEGMEYGFVEGMTQAVGGVSSPMVTFGLHMLGARTATDRLYNFHRTQAEILEQDLLNFVPGRRLQRDIREILSLPLESRTGKSYITTERFKYMPFWQTGLREKTRRETMESRRKKQGESAYEKYLRGR